ncbi:basic proline-rich protein-like [Apus apus]|uniref:basic proline-rich protein-like n=1 Tax=Apus apus TaxID=8895 RepID=UPI0021F82163|nr:basic proline-rich protein-like [Apus apus]
MTPGDQHCGLPGLPRLLPTVPDPVGRLCLGGAPRRQGRTLLGAAARGPSRGARVPPGCPHRPSEPRTPSPLSGTLSTAPARPDPPPPPAPQSAPGSPNTSGGSFPPPYGAAAPATRGRPNRAGDGAPTPPPGQRGLCTASHSNHAVTFRRGGGERRGGEEGGKVVPSHRSPRADFTMGRWVPPPPPRRAGQRRSGGGAPTPPLQPPEERAGWAERSRRPQPHGPAIRLPLTQRTEAPGRRDGQEPPPNGQAGWPPKM